MANNKQPHKHKQTIPPLLKLKLESEFKKENEKAKTAGVEYGILAMRIAILMIATKDFNADDDSIKELVEKLKSCKDIIMEKKPIIDMIKNLQDKGYNISTDDLVKMDSSLGQYM